jgi:hypothetical protein
VCAGVSSIFKGRLSLLAPCKITSPEKSTISNKLWKSREQKLYKKIYGSNRTYLLYCIIDPSSNLRDETGSSDFKNLDGARLKNWRVGGCSGGGDIGLAVLAVLQLKNTYIILLIFSCISLISSESCPHNLCEKQIAPPRTLRDNKAWVIGAWRGH